MAATISPTAYLIASGAKALVIYETDGTATITIDARPHRGAAAIWWVPRSYARPIAAKARFIAGPDPDIARLSLAIHAAAEKYKVPVTEHAVAVRRAAEAIKRLDVAFEELRKDGQLQVFNKVYQAKRQAARSIGRGFMSYPQATARLRRALVPILVRGGRDVPASLFAEVFSAR